jgi:hypothetical protein
VVGSDVWLPLVTLVIGYGGSLVTESRRDKRLENREERARGAAREQAREDQRHESDMASEARLYADVKDAYVRLLEKLYELGAAGEGTPRAELPLDQPPPGLLKLIADSDWQAAHRLAHAQATVVGSDEVVAGLDTWEEAFGDFWTVLGRVEKEGAPFSEYVRAKAHYEAKEKVLTQAMRNDIRRIT